MPWLEADSSAPGQTTTSTLTLSGSTQTITTQLPASTIVSTILSTRTLTSLSVSTQLVPTTVIETVTPSQSSQSSPSPSVSCGAKCQIDVTGTRLEYPGRVIVSTKTVPVTYLDVYLDSASRTTSTALTTSPIPTSTSSLTWVYESVTL